MKGGGAKKFGMSLEPGKSNFFGGISRDFAGISQGRPKSLRNKSLCSILVPYLEPSRNTLENNHRHSLARFVLLLEVIFCLTRLLLKIASKDAEGTPAWSRFGSVAVRAQNVSCTWFQFSVLMVSPRQLGHSPKRVVSVFPHSLKGMTRFPGKTVPTVTVPTSVPGKRVPTVPVSGSGVVPAPS